MRIRLLAAVGGRPVGAEFDHDQAGADALISAGFAEQVEHQEHDERPAEQPAAPAPTGPGESAVPSKRSRTPRRG